MFVSRSEVRRQITQELLRLEFFALKDRVFALESWKKSREDEDKFKDLQERAEKVGLRLEKKMSLNIVYGTSDWFNILYRGEEEVQRGTIGHLKTFLDGYEAKECPEGRQG